MFGPIYLPFPVLVEGPDQLGAVVEADGVAIGAGEVALAVADGHDGGGLAHPDRLPALARLRRPQANGLRAQKHVIIIIVVTITNWTVFLRLPDCRRQATKRRLNNS